MAVVRLSLVAIACLFTMVTQKTDAIKGGTKVSHCYYPGVAVAISVDTQAILCSGVIINKVFHLPMQCNAILQSAKSTVGFEVKTGRYKWTFPNGTTILPGSTTTQGTYKLNLPDAYRSDINVASCSADAKLYDGTEALKLPTCQLIGYGANTNTGANYNLDGLKAVSVIKSTGAGCCNAISDTLTTKEKGIGHYAGYPFNCFTVAGSPCGLGDLGGPIMCDTASGKKVTIGLTASMPCVDKGLFVAQDTTNSSPNVKFGIPKITKK